MDLSIELPGQSHDSLKVLELDGIVIPTQWDRRGAVIQVAIQTTNFEKYLISDNKTLNLLNMIDQHIHIRGVVVGEDVKGFQIIEIDGINDLMPNQQL